MVMALLCVQPASVAVSVSSLFITSIYWTGASRHTSHYDSGDDGMKARKKDVSGGLVRRVQPTSCIHWQRMGGACWHVAKAIITTSYISCTGVAFHWPCTQTAADSRKP